MLDTGTHTDYIRRMTHDTTARFDAIRRQYATNATGLRQLERRAARARSGRINGRTSIEWAAAAAQYETLATADDATLRAHFLRQREAVAARLAALRAHRGV